MLLGDKDAGNLGFGRVSSELNIILCMYFQSNGIWQWTYTPIYVIREQISQENV
jgi:hypothetical protein